MFDSILIDGISPYLLALLPFVIVGLIFLVREGFKAAGKEIPEVATHVIAFVLSLAAVAGSFALSGKPLPADVTGWLQLTVSLFTLQMAAYEVIVKRVLKAFGK